MGAQKASKCPRENKSMKLHSHSVKACMSLSWLKKHLKSKEMSRGYRRTQHGEYDNETKDVIPNPGTDEDIFHVTYCQSIEQLCQ